MKRLTYGVFAASILCSSLFGYFLPFIPPAKNTDTCMLVSARPALLPDCESKVDGNPETGRGSDVPPSLPGEKPDIDSVRLAYSQALMNASIVPVPTRKKPEPKLKPEPPAKKAVASWYGEKFRGKRMKNGDIFNPDLITVAHRSFEVDKTVLKITNPENGMSIVAPVTDRGPFKPGRDFDLSYAAFKALGVSPEIKGLLKITFRKL